MDRLASGKFQSWWLVGIGAAIAITTAMDATGLSMFSTLPLLPLGGALWALQRFSRQQMGLQWGAWEYYVAALLYPVVVLGLATGIAVQAGATQLAEFDVARFAKLAVINGGAAIIAVLLTEEGFFRGWLWASLKGVCATDKGVLVCSSLLFSLWHLSAVSLDTGFDLPLHQIPVFMLNATVLGLIWGLLRWASGSIVVASVSHSVWNGANYELFGFGTRVGSLGITDTHTFGTETGWVGFLLNCIFAYGLWRWIAGRAPAGPNSTT